MGSVKRILVAGPDWGMEMGWLLHRWQGYVRLRSQEYDQTVVITTDEMYPVYQDFAVRVPTIGTKDRFRYADVHVEYLRPTKEICQGNIKQRFIKYGTVSLRGHHYVVIHARDDMRTPIRNWPYQCWEVLVKQFPKVRFVCIGAPDASMKVNGCEDKRGALMTELFEVLSSAKLCLGPSSGPMHLASLCGCPHLIWTDHRVWNLGECKGTNRMRYSQAWNPFGTPVTVLDSEGWRPSVAAVANTLEGLL